MPKARAIWYAHAIDDFDRDTRHLSLAARGAYRALIDRYHEAGEPPKADDRSICRMIFAMPDEWAEVRDEVLSFFDVREGRLFHKRVQADIKKAREKQEAARDRIARARAAKTAKPDNSVDDKPENRTDDKLGDNADDSFDRNADDRHQAQAQAQLPNGSTVSEATPPLAVPDTASDGAERGGRSTRKRKRQAVHYEPDFLAFYERYPRKEGKAAGQKTWREMDGAERKAAYDAAERYAEVVADRPQDKIPYVSTWLNDRRWEDSPKAGPPPPGRNALAAHGFRPADGRQHPKLLERQEAFSNIRARIAGEGGEA